MQMCFLCHQQSDHEVLIAHEMVHGSREPFDYGLCGACGTLALIDPPSDLAPYYENYYSTSAFDHNPFNQTSAAAKYILNPIKRWALRYSILSTGALARYIYHRKSVASLNWGPLFSEFRKLDFHVTEQTSFLDIGCGHGRGLRYLASAGFRNLTGCDPFIEKDVALEPHGHIFKTDVDAIEGQYQVIMFHHSFEHLPDPSATLKNTARLLAPGGLVLLRFPNIASLSFRKHRERWWAIHAPRHFYLPSLQAMRIIANEAGLEIVSNYCDANFDHYLYSDEHEMGIYDQHPLSLRVDEVGTWTKLELENAREKTAILNRKMCSDYVAYILQRPAVATPV